MLKVGIIGSGFGLYGLLPAFGSLSNCQVVSLAGKKTDRVISECRKYSVRSIYSDWQEMLRNEKLDAVALAVTPPAQFEVAKAALQKKLCVFAEKPLAANLSQAKELLNLATRQKLTHGIDFLFPEIPAWKKAKQLLDQKKMGELEHISVDWNFLSFDIQHHKASWKTNPREGGGALSFYFSHALHYLEYFAGHIEQVQSLFGFSAESLNGGEVEVDLLLKFSSGVNGSAHVCCNTRGPAIHKVTFRCQRGLIVLENEGDVFTHFRLMSFNDKGIKKNYYLSNLPSIKDEDERVVLVKILAKKFITACSHHTETKPSFREGMRVQELIEKVKNGQIR